MHLLDLSLVQTQAFHTTFEQQFTGRLNHLISQHAYVAGATRRLDGVDISPNCSGYAIWTNVMINLMINWLREGGMWGYCGVGIDLCTDPREGYSLSSQSDNCIIGREYLWDITAGLVSGTGNGTWEDWLASQHRIVYHGAYIAVESEWASRSQCLDDAITEFYRDFVKLLDANIYLGVFIYRKMTDPQNLTIRVLRQVYQDRNCRHPIVCIGIPTQWSAALVNQIDFTWLRNRSPGVSAFRIPPNPLH